MKRAIFFALCFLSITASALDLEFTHNGTQSFVTPLQDPTDYCYPPEGQPFSNYFTDNKCYYRFNNSCSSAAIVPFVPGDPQKNANFFALCSQVSDKLGPQFIFYVEPLPENPKPSDLKVGTCILLPNRSSTDTHKAKVKLFADTNPTPNPNFHVPGCLPNKIGILDIQPGPHTNQNVTVQITCQDVFTRAETTATATIDPAKLNYTECPQ